MNRKVHYNYGQTESFTLEKPEEHDYVDLGFPSGTLWATCNVGAETSLDRGKYFSWGETEQKYYYDWWEYQYCEGGYNNMTKYCTDSQFGTVDGLKELMPEDDAATVNWGADWRTPSYEQVRELTNSCYTTKHAIEKDGVEGEFINKINGNTLFFPYNGYARKGELNSYSSGVYCWSRSLYTSWVSKGYVLTSSSTYAFDRKDGLGVRPVRVKEDNHEYVDLGLPSGTLWATCNIGANSPEETGIYVAWGETQPKSSGYEWSVYSHCINYEYNLTKYCIDPDLAYKGQEEIDNLKELLPEDDAATTNWGENWQMPSLAQVEELLDNKYTTTKDWSLNGVKGRLITSNKNGKWIFIPYTGYVSGGSVYSADSYGYLWSRSLDLERECYYARSWRVSTNDVGPDHGSRCLGENVRAVRKKK